MTYILEAKTRNAGTGQDLAVLRQSSQVPGVIYGVQDQAQTLAVNYNELLKVITAAGTSQIVKLKLDGQEMPVLIREWQQDPVSEKIIHVDFLQVADDQPIFTKVPLKFVGLSIGVKEKGGKLDIKNSQVNVKCLPVDLPSEIEVDITILADLNQAILIKDLQVSDKVIILNNPTDPVVSVIVPKKLEVISEADAAKQAEAAAAAAPVVEGQPAEGAETPAEGAAVEGEAKK